MTKRLMTINCYDGSDVMIIVGSCLKAVQPEAFKKLKEISSDLYELCLEETHVNMAITKIIGILSRITVKKMVFATVDKSPHCVQMHYIESEIKKAMPTINTEFVHFVAVDNNLIEISFDIIQQSKNLSLLEKNKSKNL